MTLSPSTIFSTDCSEDRGAQMIRLKNLGWNPSVKARLETIISEHAYSGAHAVFDMDNTILCRDIGEPVFSLLENEGLLKRYPVKRGLSAFDTSTTKELSKSAGSFYADLGDQESLCAHYNRLLEIPATGTLNEDLVSDVYVWLVQVMERAPLRDVLRITDQVFGRYASNFKMPEFVPNTPFRSPFVYPEMIDLIAALLANGIKVWIVSASNIWTVRRTVESVINPALQALRSGLVIDQSNVFGLAGSVVDSTGNEINERQLAQEAPNYLTKINDGLLELFVGKNLELPASCYSGKAAIVKREISKKPILIAGDSPNDFPMMEDALNRLFIHRVDKKAYLKEFLTRFISVESSIVQSVDTASNPGFLPVGIEN